MSDPCSGESRAEVTNELVDDLVRLGGYTHPLFADRSPHAGRPMPGQGVLLLMGGLVEQSGRLDDAVALLEMKSARFHRMVTAGTQLRVDIERGDERLTASGRRLGEFTWTAVDGDGPVATVDVVMLMNQTDHGKAQEDQ